MTSGPRVVAARAIDAALARRGFTGVELELASASVREWARVRLQGAGRRGSVAGLGVVVPRPGRAELVTIEVPLAGPGEVTVELLVSAISSGTERAQWLRLPNAQPTLPYRPGYSGSGRVLALGAGVEGLRLGQLVAVPRAPHASVVTLPAEWVVPVPGEVSPEAAALVYLAIISGYGVRRAALQPGDPVCVLGGGPIGALALRLAQQAGAGSLTLTARSRRHQSVAARSGAAFQLVAAGLSDVQAAVAIDATGDPSAVAMAVAAVRDGGRVVLLGSPRGSSPNVPVAEIQQRGLQLVGAHVSALAKEAKQLEHDPFRDLARDFLAAVATDSVPVDDLVGEAVDPREIGLLYRRLSTGVVTGAHLDWRRLPARDRVLERRVLSPPRLRPLQPAVPPVPATPTRMSQRTLRFAVLGCGDIGLRNARAVARARNAELVLVHDAVPALAHAAAAAHGGTVVRTVDEALDARRVDAVLLSVPHHLHTPLIVRAAEAGLHIVVEKPLAVDLASARTAAGAAERAGVVLSVCFPYRYEAAPAAAGRLVTAGALGALRGAAVLFHADKPPSYWQGGFSGRASSSWRRSREEAGGGVMIMNLTHHVDLARYVTGCEVVSVTATARTDPGEEVEDSIAVSLSFAGGAVGTMLGSASTRGAPASRVELWGDVGTLQLEPEPRIFSERNLPGLEVGRWNALPTQAVDERLSFVERFADAVLDQRPPDVTAADGLAVQAVVEAVYRSAASGGLPEPVEHAAVPS